MAITKTQVYGAKREDELDFIKKNFLVLKNREVLQKISKGHRISS